jgi:hypothetical protein
LTMTFAEMCTNTWKSGLPTRAFRIAPTYSGGWLSRASLTVLDQTLKPHGRALEFSEPKGAQAGRGGSSGHDAGLCRNKDFAREMTTIWCASRCANYRILWFGGRRIPYCDRALHTP